MQTLMSASRYFPAAVLRCGCGCGFGAASARFLRFLDSLYERVGRPLTVNSFCRCPAWNEAVGGVPDSPHTRGLAVDFGCLDDSLRAALVGHWLALVREHRLPLRVELGYDYVHLDIDEERPDRLWFNAENFLGCLVPPVSAPTPPAPPSRSRSAPARSAR